MKQESLTIYLTKAGNEAAETLIKGLAALDAHPVTDDDGALGTLYVERRHANPPSWGKFFEPQVARAALGLASSTAGIFHLVVDGRAFLITFGQGRHLIKSGVCEERFGLKVTLNSIGGNQIRSIDKHTLDTTGRLTRVQSSREAASSEFGLDVERDLLKAITGTPADVTLGRTMSGLDSLHVSVEVSLQSLRQLLSSYLHQFGLDTYKRTFPWVDHIAPVQDPVLIEALDVLMLEVIAAARADKCWLAVPEPIEWTKIAGFRYGNGRKHARFHDIDLGSFLSEHDVAATAVTTDLLKKHKIVAVDGNDQIDESWPAYQCVYCEVDRAGETYLLSGGSWYKIETDFVQQINQFYATIPRYQVAFPEYNDASEGDYSERVVQLDAANYSLLDKKLIRIPVGRSSIEFCDLFGHRNDLIHIKRYGGSGVLSHLFAQGVVSGELLVSDANFRGDVNPLLPAACRLADTQARPNTALFQVVFAIVSPEPGAGMELPFFSRLSLRHAIQTLDNFGYRVALAKISTNAELLRTKKMRAAERRRA